MSAVTLKLFVAGHTHRSLAAIQNIRSVFFDTDEAGFDLTIIDVLEEPEKAEEYYIIATPTLLKITPPPVKRIVGDLSDHRALILGLGITPINLEDSEQ